MSGMLSFIFRIGLFVIAVFSLAVAGIATYVIFLSMDDPALSPMPVSHSFPTVPALGPASQQPQYLCIEARPVIETKDGGQLSAGRAMTYASQGKDWDFYVNKTDKSGNELWTWTDDGAQYDYAWDIAQADDGGFAIAGSTQSDGTGPRSVCIFKIDAAGRLQWNHTYCGDDTDDGYALQNNRDGGFTVLALGSSDDHNQGVVIIDRNGQQLWDKANGSISPGLNGSNNYSSNSHDSNGSNSDKAGNNGQAADRGQSHN